MELSRLSLAYPDRVDKLVYLDAADLSERFRPDREEPPGPPITDDDRASLRAYQAAVARFFGHREFKAAVCNSVLFGPSGQLVDSSTPDEIGEKISADVDRQRPTNWRKIAAPRLAIFATFSPELRVPWYWYLSADEQAAFDRAWLPIVEWHVDTIESFRSHGPENPEPILRELPGAAHYIYITNEAFVVREMLEFLLGDVTD